MFQIVVDSTPLLLREEKILLQNTGANNMTYSYPIKTTLEGFALLLQIWQILDLNVHRLQACSQDRFGRGARPTNGEPLEPLQNPIFWPILWLKVDFLADFRWYITPAPFHLAMCLVTKFKNINYGRAAKD